MRLEPLYRIRFTYPESWMISLDGGWEQHLFLAEGRCDGAISGRFRGANFPRRARPGVARSSGPSFTPATPTSTGNSTMPSASVSARSARRPTLHNQNPISSLDVAELIWEPIAD